ncbi:MAG: hypothetical protein ACREA2_07055 [Blastocatellia bacterium]
MMMKSRNISIGAAFAACLLCQTIAVGQNGENPKGALIIDTSVNIKGERVRGPKTIRLINLNRIRYKVEVGTETTDLAGPSLALPFIPQFPEAGDPQPNPESRQLSLLNRFLQEMPGQKAKGKEEKDSKSAGEIAGDDQFEKVRQTLFDIETKSIVNKVSNPIADALNKTRLAVNATNGLVRVSDDLLIKGASQFLSQLATVISKIEEAQKPLWPDPAINELLGSLSGQKTTLLAIPADWLAIPINKTRYDSANALIDQLREKLLSFSHNNDPNSLAGKFDEAQKKLEDWRTIFEAAQEAGKKFFTQDIDVGCGFVFAGSKQTKLNLTRKDRLAPEDSQAETRELVTVECSAPLSISGGFGLSTLEEQEFALVQSTKTVADAAGKPTEVLVNRLGFKNQSSFRTLPVLMLNTRLWEPSDTYALHASIGAAVNFKGQVGTDVEFIVGPSLSLKRAMFITPGLHVGRVSKLAGGFKIGDEAPTGVSEPPLEKSWRPRFAVSVTFKIR